MRKYMFKRISAILLSAALCLNMSISTTFAQPEEGHIEETTFSVDESQRLQEQMEVEDLAEAESTDEECLTEDQVVVDSDDAEQDAAQIKEEKISSDESDHFETVMENASKTDDSEEEEEIRSEEETVTVEAGMATLADLRSKFPAGRYWNHAGNPGSSNSVNNQNGTTGTPCPQHGNVGKSSQTCNGFQPESTQLSWQCMGYAEKLGYDYSGANPRNNSNGWSTSTSSSALDSLKAGDIVRYKNNGHSIFVTAVNGDTVTYTDCNSDGHCIIRWDQTISKSTLRSTFTHVRRGPGLGPTPDTCNCSTSYAGTYKCTTSSSPLLIRSGHGTSFSSIGSIPSGATVTVSKANGSWAHVSYNGVNGYSSMEYLQKVNTGYTLNLRSWVSETGMGSSAGSYLQGKSYYACYELSDKDSGTLVDALGGGNYTITEQVYNPNGSLLFEYSYSNDNNWIRFTPTYAGEYTIRYVIKGTILGDNYDTYIDKKIIVQANPTTVSTNKSAITLVLGSYPNDTATITLGGYYNGSRKLNFSKSNSNVSLEWGNWNGDTCSLNMTGVTEGTCTVTVRALDSDTDAVLASCTINVTVTSSNRTLSYNANGGSGAPSSQTGSGSMTVSSTIPTRFGYTFLGWSTSSTATSASYKPGSSISLNSNTTLYAVWGSPVTISGSVTDGNYSAQVSVAGAYSYLKFVPSSTASYRFESTGSTDTKGWLYDATGNELKNDDDSGAGNNFRIDYNCTAGTTYYLGVKYYTSSNTGTISVNVKKAFTLSYSANGGSGAPSSQTVYPGESITLSSVTPSKSYTVTYNANGGSCSTTSASKSCTFNGWNTSSAGTGTSYSAGGTYTGTTSSVTLYAKWNNPTYSSLPTPTRSGYTFEGWYTAASGGTKVTTGTTVTGNITLYAHWTEIPKATYTISYNANGGTGAPSSQTKTEGVSLTLSSVEPTKSYTVTYNANGGTCSTTSAPKSCTFTGWNTSSSGTGTSYSKGGNYTANASATLYAQWTNPTYGSLPTPARSGYSFDGWYTSSTGGTKVSTGTAVTGNITLYAHWTSVNVTLTYNTNGGGTAPDSQTGSGSMTVSSTILTRFGYSFLGWSTSSTAKTASYLPGSSITVSQNTTLYAVWEAAVDLLAATAPEVKISYGGQVKYFVIRPETAGSYTIESTGDGDTYGYLYDASGNQLHSNDDGAGSRNFRITYTLESGKTYYLMVRYYNSSVKGSFGLTVKVPVPEKKLVITSQPQNVTAGINSTVSFRVAAEGENLTYQWQYSKNGGEKWLVSGATGAATDSISLKVSASNAGNIYRCRITGNGGKEIYSAAAGVDLIPGAVIIKNPQSAVAAIGEYAVFTVTVENAASYQWQYSKDGSHWYNSGAEGNKTDVLKVKGAQNSQGNRYRCVVTGVDGNKKKSLMAAMIVLQTAPKNSTAAVGQTATFSLKAEGIASYQWQYSKDGGNTWYKSGAAGAETDTVSFKVASSNKAMIYRCKLTTEDGAYAFTRPVGF